MHIDSLLNHVHQYGYVSHLKLIKNRVDEWFKLQKQPFLCLTNPSIQKLTDEFYKDVKNLGQVEDLIAYVANKTLVSHKNDFVQNVESILEKSQCTIADYKELLAMTEIMSSAITSILDDRSLFWCQEKYLNIYEKNIFLKRGPHQTKKHPLIEISPRVINGMALDPSALILYSRILIFFNFRTNGNYNADPEKLVFDDQFITDLIELKHLSQNPVFRELVDEFLELGRLISLRMLFDDLATNCIRINIEPKQANFLRSICPTLPLYNVFHMSSHTFNFDTPFDGTRMFEEITRNYTSEREKICGAYRLLTDKMSEIRKNSPLHGRISDEKMLEIMPLPRRSYDEYRADFDLLLDYKYETDFHKKIDLIESNFVKKLQLLRDEQEKTEEEKNLQPTIEIVVQPSDETVVQPLRNTIPTLAPFRVNPRVLRWFDPSLDMTRMAEYAHVTHSKYDEIKFIHNFAWIVNDIAVKHGKEFFRDNKNGVQEKMISMMIQAETPFSSRPVNYTLTITFNQNNEVYHRTLTQRPQGQMIQEMIEQGVFEKEFPPLSSLKFDVAMDHSLRFHISEDGSYIHAVDGRVVTVADPKWLLADGTPTLLHVIVL